MASALTAGSRAQLLRPVPSYVGLFRRTASHGAVRNTVPRLAVRWAVALAVMAAVVAPPLSVGSPASAQTQTGDEIWSATMTVGIQNHLEGGGGGGTGAPIPSPLGRSPTTNSPWARILTP